MSVKPQKSASKKQAKVAVTQSAKPAKQASQSIKSSKKTKQPITQSDDQPDNESADIETEHPVSAVKPKKRRAEETTQSSDQSNDNQSTSQVTEKKRKLAAESPAATESESTSQSTSQSSLPAIIANPDSIEAKLTGDIELNYDFEKVDWSKKTESKDSDDQSYDDKTIKAIKAMGFEKMTEIQARTIPAMMHGVDIMGQAKTGSGKTLSFLIPAVHLLWNLNFKQRNGTGVLIIAPTRELALQIYGVARELTQFHSLTVGCVMGGANRKNEVDKLTKGCNILIGTPGRLLDHINNTPGFQIANLKLLIMDEADRILEIGFEQELKEILSKLPKNENRQTCLFSATQSSTGIRDLVKLSLKRNPLMINVSGSSSVATVSTLEQGYVICPSSQRFLLLFTFLKKNLLKKKKIIVFFSTCAATQFYSELLNYIDLPCLELHGQLKQNKRTSTFFEFINSTHGILLATDVAARGLDIPKVDWIIQFDPPEDPKEYIHRVGRTARGLNSTGGKALLFLLPNELLFLKYLKSAKVPLNEYEFPLNKLATVQNQLEELINKNYYLHKSAREAYRSYLQAYAQHSLKNCFNVQDLNVTEVAASFGFQAPPKVHLKIGIKQKKPQGRHGFDDDNPYGEHKLQAEQPARREEAINEDLNGNAAYEKTAKPAFDRRAAKQWSK